MRLRIIALAIAAIALASGAAQAAKIKITVENLSGVGGVNLSPLWVAFHDGSFDVFNAGALATPGLEPLAEAGDPSGLAARLAATDPGAVTGLIPVVGASGLPQIEPGESGSIVLNVNPSADRFFDFAAMVVPSNDAFTSLDDALQVFDASGHFLGNKTITLTGNDIWDAGTEVNQLFGSAFIVGQNAALGDAESNPVALHPGFGIFDGLTEANGQTFMVADADVAARAGFVWGRITISEVPEPGTLALAFAAFGLAAYMIRRYTRAAAI